LDLLDKDALMRIIKEPKNALLKQYKKLFELDGVQLEMDDDAVEEVAKKALERKTGARGLRSIMEELLLDTMYSIPSEENANRCLISKECVTEKKAPKITYTERCKKSLPAEESVS